MLDDIRRVVVVGTGLLGASVGKGLKAGGFDGEIVGVGRTAVTLERAVALGAIDRGLTQLEEAVGGVDGPLIVVIAVPVGRFGEVFRKLAEAQRRGMVLTDVGSTKASVAAEAKRYLKQPQFFVPAHPMAGSERSGPDAADARLFQGKPCVLCPTADTDASALAVVSEMWEALGAKLCTMTADQHDRQVAAVSHLPHLLAVLLAHTADDMGPLDLASSGFRDTSRLALSNPPMRTDIVMANRKPIGEAARPPGVAAQRAARPGSQRQGGGPAGPAHRCRVHPATLGRIAVSRVPRYPAPMKYRLGLIGAGNMAEAIARGAIESGVLSADQIVAADPSPARQQVFKDLGIAVTSEPGVVVQHSQQVLLAVKPQVFPQLGDVLKNIDRDRQIVISIMAGIKSTAIEAAAGGPTKVIRVMPNTPLMVGRGMSGLAECGTIAAGSGDAQLCVDLLNGCGKVAKVSEAQLDAVTAVSGSGPAYVFLLAEAMMAVAAELGLAGAERLFVQQTIQGAAEMLTEDGDTAAELRRKVTSPGGTTQAAIESLQAQGFEQRIADAITAARDRSAQLGG